AADEGGGQAQGEGRGTKQGHRDGRQVDVACFTAVVGWVKDGVAAAEGIEPVERFVAVQTGGPFTQLPKAQGGGQQQDGQPAPTSPKTGDLLCRQVLLCHCRRETYTKQIRPSTCCLLPISACRSNLP